MSDVRALILYWILPFIKERESFPDKAKKCLFELYQTSILSF
jgi:hypothetical protein